LEIFTLTDLPIEEATFFLLTLVIVVTGNFAIEKSLAIIKVYPDLIDPNPASEIAPKTILASPSFLPSSPLQTLSNMWKAFLLSQESLSYQRIRYLKGALNILQSSSATFRVVGWMLPWDLRLDLAIIYAFCHATSDLIRSTHDKFATENRRSEITLVKDLIDIIYSTPTDRATSQRHVQLFCKEKQIPDWAEEAACAFASVADAVPKKEVLEFVGGCERDWEGKEMESVDHLVDHCRCVGGSVGAMCAYVVLDRTLRAEMHNSRKEDIVDKSRDMGIVSTYIPDGRKNSPINPLQSFQLTNIARDILTDFQSQRRYIPAKNGTIPTKQKALLRGTHQDAGAIPKSTVEIYALSILDLADKHHSRSVSVVKELPVSCRGGVRAVCKVYREMALAIRNTSGYHHDNRGSVLVSRWRMVWIGMKALYWG
jgi:15-cis-phytoene synthase/lycopene beta-cyclase